MRSQPSRRRSELVASFAVLLAAVAACSGPSDEVSGTTDATGTTGITADATTLLRWQEVGEGVEAATLVVPLDHDDPGGPIIELPLLRRPARDPAARIGALLVNPGGPGFGGTGYVRSADRVLAPELLDRFDIVGWDPRGTAGSSAPINCIDDYDERYADIDVTPDNDTDVARLRELAETFAAGCVERAGGVIQHVSTADSARDMDALRQALGEEQVSYLGFSYGSELGAAWAEAFPTTVRAAVIDGAADLGADWAGRTVQAASGFEAALSAYLARCSADPSCAFHSAGDAEAAFDALMATLDAAPLVTEPGRPPVSLTVGLGAVRQGLYSAAFWPQLSDALAAATVGDGRGLLMLWDAYHQRQTDGHWPDTLESLAVITCMDQPERPTVEEVDALVPALTAAAPRMAPVFARDYTCSFLPPSDHPRALPAPSRDVPMLAIGTTGDPATPLDGTRATATLLGATLVVVEADQHTGYGTSACVDAIVTSFLTDLEAPANGATC